MRNGFLGFLLLVAALPLFAQRVTGLRGGTAAAPEAATRPGDPLPGLTEAQIAAFEQGFRDFTRVRTPFDGLGPIFNASSCSSCHRQPAIGAAGQRRVTRFGAVDASGKFDSLDRFGGPLLQEDVLGPEVGLSRRFTPERVPSQATIITTRRTTSLLGLGFVEATPDATFIALAAEQVRRNPATAGRVAMVWNIAANAMTVGKFGAKAQVPTLRQFAGDAYLNELGVTSPEFPGELCANNDCSELRFNPAPGLNDTGSGVASLANFMALLAPPSPEPPTQQTLEGARVFERIGCAECHLPSLRTGDHPIAALAHKTYRPYSDFLLHDMGAGGDRIAQGDASGSEHRTAPLWGLRRARGFMHDGNALTVEDAIARHDGQGRASREAFNALDAKARARLLAFLESL